MTHTRTTMPRNHHILNKRYARAFLSLAEENNILERSYEDMKNIHEVFSRNKDLAILLKSPVIRNTSKQNVLSRLFKHHVHPFILRYMMLIVRKQRGGMLEGISGAYIALYKQYAGIERVKVTTAVPMDDQLRMRALEAARKLTPHEIEFEEHIDPDIIGGFILHMEEKRYDASVKHRFQQMKKHLSTL